MHRWWQKLFLNSLRPLATRQTSQRPNHQNLRDSQSRKQCENIDIILIQESDVSYQPTLLPSRAAFDIISFFKPILNQQFSHFQRVTIKTAFHNQMQNKHVRQHYTSSNMLTLTTQRKVLILI